MIYHKEFDLFAYIYNCLWMWLFWSDFTAFFCKIHFGCVKSLTCSGLSTRTQLSSFIFSHFFLCVADSSKAKKSPLKCCSLVKYMGFTDCEQYGPHCEPLWIESSQACLANKHTLHTPQQQTSRKLCVRKTGESKWSWNMKTDECNNKGFKNLCTLSQWCVEGKYVP